MSIPLAMSPVGYDAWVTKLRRALITYLGTLHLEVDYLPDEKKLVVHTDRVSDETYAEVAYIVSEYIPNGVTLEQYNHHWEISWRDINKYAECTNIADIYAVNPDYKNDVTSDGAWIYPLPKMKNFSQRYPHNIFENAGLCMSKTVKMVDLELPYDTRLDSTFRDMPNLKHIRLSAPSATYSDHAWSGSSNIKTFELYAPKLTRLHCLSMTTYVEYIKLYVPLAKTVDLRKCPKLTTIDAELPSLSDVNPTWGGFGTGAKLNKESVLKVCNSLPSYDSGTHRIQFGIHIDHKYDPEVNTVLKRTGGAPGTTNEYFPPDGVVIDPIADNEYKGWTLTVQWNGKATADAYPAPTTT